MPPAIDWKVLDDTFISAAGVGSGVCVYSSPFEDPYRETESALNFKNNSLYANKIVAGRCQYRSLDLAKVRNAQRQQQLFHPLHPACALLAHSF